MDYAYIYKKVCFHFLYEGSEAKRSVLQRAAEG